MSMHNQNFTLQDLAELIKSNKSELSEQINNMHLRLEEKFTNEITEVKKDIEDKITLKINSKQLIANCI